MATSYTSLLGLALPVTGELQGTWGDTVNDAITSLLDSAVAGTTTLNTDGDVTLTTTTGAANQARQAILLCTGARTALRTITAPAQSKIYTVINATTGGFGVKIVGAGPTTGVTLVAGETALIAWNGSDFIRISSNSVLGNVTVTNLTDTALTSGRVTYASTGGLLVDSANMTFNGTRLTVADFADASLTSGRVTFAGAGGALSDSANLTFDGTTLTAANFADSSLTSGRVTFAGAGGNLSDSANLTWNGSTLAITGALTATADSVFSSTGALLISKGTTVQQPGSPVTGMLRYNTTTNQFEGYSGSSPAWNPVGGASLSNDTSTATNVFPLFANATTGSATTIFTSNAKLLYKPSTGEFQSSAVVASNGIFVNSQTVTANYTVPSGSNAMSSGPVTVADGITVTVSDGSVWTVI